MPSKFRETSFKRKTTNFVPDCDRRRKARFRDTLLTFFSNIPVGSRGPAVLLALKHCLQDENCRLKLNDVAEGFRRHGIVIKMQESSKPSTSFTETEWPGKIRKFLETDAISRLVPGKSVSVKYKQHEQKYLLNHTRAQVFKLFKQKNPDFKYAMTTFCSAIPRNFCTPKVNDVKQNVCTLCSNVRALTTAFNSLLGRLGPELQYLQLPSEKDELMGRLVCNDSGKGWEEICCSSMCPECGAGKLVEHLRIETLYRVPEDTEIKYTIWESVEVASGSGSTKTDHKFTHTLPIGEFLVELEDLLRGFALHRYVWKLQGKIFYATLPPIIDTGTISIRTCVDFQMDYLHTLDESTVASFRIPAFPPVVVYPAHVEVFHSDGKTTKHCLIFLSDRAPKNHATVHEFTVLTIEAMAKMHGKKVKRFHRISDGASSQFWCYGTYVF